jgi:hypothetical protein
MPNKNTETSIGELKLTTFEVPPEGFDPLTAPPSKLLHHGVAPRPDKDKDPELYKKWHKVYSKKLTHIIPEFLKNESKQHRPVANRVDIKDGTSTSTNWSGGVVPSPAGDTFKWITGNWIVPDPNQPPGLPTGQWYYSSAWIGIDGWGSNDVLQAGTDSDVLVQNGVAHKSVAAWWEWFPNSSVTITNLPVTSGDYMTCLICSTGATTATIYLTNLSTNTHVSFQITIPSGATFNGNCAEWILEAPTVNGGQSALCDYGATFFDEAYAYTAKNVQENAGVGNTVNMVNSANSVISQALIEAPQLLKVSFV